MNIDMMPWRVQNLQATIDGLLASGVPLVTKVETAYGAADISDDPGLYLFAAPLGAWLGLDAATAATLFFAAVLTIAVIAGSLGIRRAFGTPMSRTIGVLALCALGVVAAVIGDVYVASATTMMAMIPWLFVVLREHSVRALLIYASVSGFIVGVSNLIRSHSGTALALVAILAFALASWAPRKTRVTAAGLLLAMMLIAPIALASIHSARDGFLSTVETVAPTAAGGHPLWHSVYIGLGYIPNEHGITYADDVAFSFVQKREPSALSGSAESEAVLRGEVLRLAKTDPAFIARGVGAKLLAELVFLIAFCNVGLVALAVARPPWSELSPLLAGLAFSALPGLLAVPAPNYMLGFAACATLLGIVGIDAWLTQRADRTATATVRA